MIGAKLIRNVNDGGEKARGGGMLLYLTQILSRIEYLRNYLNTRSEAKCTSMYCPRSANTTQHVISACGRGTLNAYPTSTYINKFNTETLME